MLFLPPLAMNARMIEIFDGIYRQALGDFKANRAHQAVEGFARLRQLAPDYPGLDVAYAKALRRDARFEDALAAFDTLKGDAVELGFEMAMCLLALGNAPEALAAFDWVLERRPNMAVAWYHSHAPALALRGMEDALRRLERAMACTGPVNGNYAALLAAYRWLQGEEGLALSLARKGRHRVLIDGLKAIKPHLRQDHALFALAPQLLAHAMDEARAAGLVLEFGVRRGTSLRHLAAIAGQEVHGFDSFEGLPEAWGSAGPGLLSTALQLPTVPANARLHPGWFEDTLPAFLAEHPGNVRFVNIDSDLHASARTVLFALAPRLVEGSVVVFDELIGNPSWKEDEFKALAEFKTAFDVQYEFFALSPATKQAALKILQAPRFAKSQ